MTVTDDNLKSVMARMGGDMALMTTLLSLLTAQSQVWVDECAVLIRQQDVAGVCRWLHTLRGSLGSLGFEDFCKELLRLELQGRSLAQLPQGVQQNDWWQGIEHARQLVRQLPGTVPSLMSRLQDVQRSGVRP